MTTNDGVGGAAEAASPNGESRPGPLPYERAQRRLRVDGKAFGTAVKRHRQAEGWSQRELSRLSGVPLTTIANLERGDTALPDPEVTCGLALTFGYGSPGSMLSRGGTRREDAGARTHPAPASPSLEATFAAVLRAAMGVLEERSALRAQSLLAPAALAAALAGGAAAGPLAAGAPPDVPTLAVNFVVIGAGGVLLLEPTGATAVTASPHDQPGEQGP